MAGSKYLRFEMEDKAPGKKTYNTKVYSAQYGNLLGVIRWYGPWRQYAFFPESSTLYSAGCLQDIQNHIIFLMERRRHEKSLENKGRKEA